MTKISVRLPTALHHKFATIARQQGKSKSELACEAVDRLLNAEGIGIMKSRTKAGALKGKRRRKRAAS